MMQSSHFQTEVCLGILDSDGCDGSLAGGSGAFTLHHYPFKRRSSQRCQILAKANNVVGGKCSSCRAGIDRRTDKNDDAAIGQVAYICFHKII